MIAWIKAHPRSAAICGTTMLLPVLFYLNLFFGAWGLRAEYAADVDRLGPRIARLQGIQQVEGLLRESSGLVQQQSARLVYPASAERTSVAAAMQSDVRQLMPEAGLTVSNSQVLPVREEEKFDYITLIGVLEYAGSFTHTQEPYKDFLLNIKKYLKPSHQLYRLIKKTID